MPLANELSQQMRDRLRLTYDIADFYGIGLLTRPLNRLFWSFRYRKPDPWNYEKSPYELRKYQVTLDQLPPPRGGAYDRVLEVACGEGVFTELLAKSGLARTLIATDIAPEAAERARTRLRSYANVTVQCNDFLRAPPDGRFDLVFCAEMLSHLGSMSRLQAIAEQFVGRLNPGGWLVLVDSFPKSRFLYRPFRSHPQLTLHKEHVERDPTRPYAVTIFQRRP
jgi:SAM-dependent methyltransferase